MKKKAAGVDSEVLQRAMESAYQKGVADNLANTDLVRQVKDLTAKLAAQSRESTKEIEELKAKIGLPVRRRLPDTRRAVTHKFTVGGHEGYMSVGMFEDGSPGELFITMAKEGSTIGGLMDTVGTLTSMTLQYGVSIEILSEKFSQQRFEPCGWTSNSEIRNATSIIDYVFRWLLIYFVQSRKVEAAPPPTEPALLVPTVVEEVKP